MRNAKSPEEERYLKSKITYIFKHRSKVHKHNAKVAKGLAELAQQIDSLSNFYVVAQAATADRIVINSPSIDKLLTEQKRNKSKQDQLLQEHQTSEAVEEMCLPVMKEEWMDKSFKPMRQLAVTMTYFMRRNLFKEANIELIAEEFEVKKQKVYELVLGKKFESGKITK